MQKNFPSSRRQLVRNFLPTKKRVHVDTNGECIDPSPRVIWPPRDQVTVPRLVMKHVFGADAVAIEWSFDAPWYVVSNENVPPVDKPKFSPGEGWKWMM